MNNSTAVVRDHSAKNLQIVYCCILGTFAPGIVVGNLLTIVTFSKKNTASKYAYILLMNLAIADILVGAISIPLFIYFVGSLNRWWGSGPRILDIIYDGNDILSGLASVFCLVCISLERLYAIGWPLNHRMTARRAYYSCVCLVWIISGLVVVLRFIVSFHTLAYIIVISFSLSLLLIFTAYIKLWCIVKTRKVDLAQRQIETRRDRKLAKTLLLVTIIFVFSWVPFQLILAIFYYFCSTSCYPLPYSVFYVTKILHYANSLVNPILYVFRMKEFRASVKEMLHCKKVNLNNAAFVNQSFNLSEFGVSTAEVMDTKL